MFPDPKSNPTAFDAFQWQSTGVGLSIELKESMLKRAPQLLYTVGTGVDVRTSTARNGNPYIKCAVQSGTVLYHALYWYVHCTSALDFPPKGEKRVKMTVEFRIKTRNY